EVNIARYHTALSLYRLGDLPAAVAEARRIQQSGHELGDIQASAYCLDVWALATGGQGCAETLQTELARPRKDAQVSAPLCLAEGVRLFMLDRADEAAAVFEKGYLLAEKADVRNPYVRPLAPWLASALRRQAEKTSPWVPAQRTALLGRAWQEACKALK